MTIIDKLATSLNRKDEGPNQELAKDIAYRDDKRAVKELVDNLYNSDKNIQSDCIKVLIAWRPYGRQESFSSLLYSRSITALSIILFIYF